MTLDEKIHAALMESKTPEEATKRIRMIIIQTASDYAIFVTRKLNDDTATADDATFDKFVKSKNL